VPLVLSYAKVLIAKEGSRPKKRDSPALAATAEVGCIASVRVVMQRVIQTFHIVSMVRDARHYAQRLCVL